ncbi:MAG: holo-ACP synthase [Clostridiales bacterium]|jgi:holo-[acyl-carrier protein] synthase|nr:holo-ACP synthase [Clostridiales bacterium]
MIIGIGTDICETARITKGTRNPRFRAKVYTDRELAYCADKPLETAAGLFAAKEAAVKAMGVGFRDFWPCDVEITRDDLGKPIVLPHGAFKDVCDLKQAVIHISISHTRESAIAFAVAETEGL